MLYLYKCLNCGEELYIEHSIKDDAKTNCPLCETESLSRVIQGCSGFILKGSGFYKNDYK